MAPILIVFLLLKSSLESRNITKQMCGMQASWFCCATNFKPFFSLGTSVGRTSASVDGNPFRELFLLSAFNVSYARNRHAGEGGRRKLSPLLSLIWGEQREQKCSFWIALRVLFRYWYDTTEFKDAIQINNIWLEERAICMIVGNLAPSKGWDEDVPKRCLWSYRAAHARWCLKKEPMLVGALLFLLAP